MPQHSPKGRRPKRMGPAPSKGPGRDPDMCAARRPHAAKKPAAARGGQDRGHAERTEPHGGERIAKVMARAGACSRRDAEHWIEAGRVAVNGVVLHDPAVNVGDDDVITIDGNPLARRARTRLFLFHKPRGLVTTEHDPEGRPTIFDHLREHWPEGPRVVSIGRLDINTEGLLLLTNDGGLARVLELPSTGWARRYRVRAKGTTDQATLDRLRRGITIDGISYAGIEATLDRLQGANCWLTIALREGKNREIKRVLEHLGLSVNRLIRLSFGPFQLGALAEGAVEEVRTRVLRDQLGPSLENAAHADFSSPLREEPEGAPKCDTPSAAGPEKPAPRRRTPTGMDHPRRDALSTQKPAPPAARKPRVRKHVSVLRREAAEIGPRKRIERAETADRKGRVVPVERRVAAAPKPTEERPSTRNGRHFEALRKEQEGAAELPRRKAPGSRPMSDRGSRPFVKEPEAGPRRENRTRQRPGDDFRSDRQGMRSSHDRPDGYRKAWREASSREATEPAGGGPRRGPKGVAGRGDKPKTRTFGTGAAGAKGRPGGAPERPGGPRRPGGPGRPSRTS